MPTQPHILLFDLYRGGHHGQYVGQLVRYWQRQGGPGRLSVAVQRSFLEAHPDVAALLAEAAPAVATVVLEAGVELQEPAPLQLLRNDRAHGRLLRSVVERLRPDHAVLLYADHAQLSLAANLRLKAPTRLSGLYFRPSLHYATLVPGYHRSLRERLQHLRKRLVLRAALRNPHLHAWYSLDPYAVPAIERLAPPSVRVVALPDGIEAPPAPEGLAAPTWLPPSPRTTALLFGALDHRKGIFHVLQAAAGLPPALQARLRVVFAGRLHPPEATRFHAALDDLRRETAVEVLLVDRFLDEAEIQPALHHADLVLLPYQQHVGSSGVLVRAAAAGRPVLGDAFGLVGEHLRRHRLGLPVDATDPAALRQGLHAFLAHPDAFPFDAEAARCFAEAHTADRFGAAFFGALTSAAS